MRTVHPMLFSLLLSSLVFSCSSAPTEEKVETPPPVVQPPPAYDTFEKGKVLNPVYVKGDSSVSYALYLPSSYSTEKKYPVIYFFDPHAGGHIPIDKYKDLAEKYNYIIIGSNNSENGMKWDHIGPVIQNMMGDAKLRMSIDPQRIYTGGFSGGARVASSTAIIIGGVSGVISCGAGIGTKQQARQKFSFFGIAGNEDFNYTELKNLNDQMDGTDWSHYLEVFDGKHEWPPVENMNDAFLWLELNAVHDGLVTKNDSLVTAFLDKNKKTLKAFSDKKNVYGQYTQYGKLNAFTSLVSADSSYRMEKRKLAATKELQEILNHKTALETKEDSLKSAYMQSLQTKDDAWWIAEVNKLNSGIKTSKDKEVVVMNKRVLSYLSLAAYMSASGALRFKDDKGAFHFITIYKLVDPTNPEYAYLSMVIYARQHESDKAIASLREAVQLGFKDYRRIVNEKDLVEISEKKEFTALLKQIKTNSEKPE